MTRYGPKVSGRGNIAPPLSYRPGLKARWLRPRPTPTTHEVTTINATLTTTPIAFDTPGLINPSDNGLPFATLTPGQFGYAWLDLSVAFDGGPEIDMVIATGPSDSHPNLIGISDASLTPQSTDNPSQTPALYDNVSWNPNAISRWFRATTPASLFAALYYPITAPTSGAGQLNAIIFTP